MASWEQRWERVTSVPPGKAIAWWLDLREDDHAVHEYRDRPSRQGKASGRRIVERSPDEVKAMDTYRGWTFPSVVRRVAHDRLEYRVGEKNFVQQATLRALPEGPGSRLVWEGRVEVKGLFGLLAPLFRGNAVRESLEDMELHARHMEREWRERPW